MYILVISASKYDLLLFLAWFTLHQCRRFILVVLLLIVGVSVAD